MLKQVDKRSVYSDKWEFEARIEIRTVTGMGSPDRSRKQSDKGRYVEVKHN
jgi:hypothetical protein